MQVGRRVMADVSVRFAITNDGAVVLNLSFFQAARLLEALTREIGETLSARAAGGGDAGLANAVPAPGMASLGYFTPS
jgi:hypothetical protein